MLLAIYSGVMYCKVWESGDICGDIVGAFRKMALPFLNLKMFYCKSFTVIYHEIFLPQMIIQIQPHNTIVIHVYYTYI